MADRRALVLVVASPRELPRESRVWGSGGWMPAEDREALDWITLVRLMGWEAQTARLAGRGLLGGVSDGSRCVLLACDPDTVGEDAVRVLAARLRQEPILVVARAGGRDTPLARLAGVARAPGERAGRDLVWRGPGPGRRWRLREAVPARSLELGSATGIWCVLDGGPAVVARAVGRGTIATLAFHPSRARDGGGGATRLLRHLVVWGVAQPAAWIDFDGVLVLRMDDPGGAQNIYSRRWSYPALGQREWAAVGAALAERDARLSIAYVPGFVDDGDETRGELEVDGTLAERSAGAVFPSPLVRYRDHGGHVPGALHDRTAEYLAIQRLRNAGLADVELHGYTHIHPDLARWAAAPDREDASRWYRELGGQASAALAALPSDRHPLRLAVAVLRCFFGTCPTTLVPPGDEWTDAALAVALDVGLQLVSSYYLALRHGDRFCWCVHVCAPYLDLPDAAWFDAGLPVVGYFHDRDVALHGVNWMAESIDRWREAGARRLVDFRDLADALGRRVSLEAVRGSWRLRVHGNGRRGHARPLPLFLRLPEGATGLTVEADGTPVALEVERLGDGLARAILPVSVPRSHRGVGAAQ